MSHIKIIRSLFQSTLMVMFNFNSKINIIAYLRKTILGKQQNRVLVLSILENIL